MMSSIPRIILPLFFFSGFCSLLYQVVWLRLAFARFGIITPVLSVVLSVFMLGLGLGSALGGRWIERRRRFTALQVYAGIETGTGIGAALVPMLFALGERWLLGGGAMNSGAYLAGSALVLTAAILPWCILMGATFPVMMAHFREARLPSAESFSRLYAANVLGAAAGSLLTAGALIELLGFHSTLMLGVAGNLAIALAALRLDQQAGPRVPAEPSAAPEAPAEPLRFERAGMLAWLFVTGFVSLGLEVVWTRAFTPVLGTTIYAFASILAIYLVATWVGSIAYRRDLRLGRTRSVAALSAAWMLAALLPIALNDSRWPWPATRVFLSLIPFCLVLGYLTPLLVDRYSGGRPAAAGRAYAWNIAGCVLGPLAVSYALLPRMGAHLGMLALAVLPALGFAVVARRLMPKQWTAVAAAALLLVPASLGVQGYEERCGGAGRAPVIVRDHVATVTCCGEGMRKQLRVNGIGITTLTPLTKIMAHLPMAAHPQPESALLICFGMGTTYRSLLSWGGEVTAVELVPGVKNVFGYYFEDADAVLAEPRGTFVVDDGRRFLMRTRQQFDVVTLDPPPPVEAAGSGLLYSKEFYALVKRRLKPDGILQQWWPYGEVKILQAAARSLQESFPHVRVYRGLGNKGFHFLASMAPVPAMTAEQFIARMPPAARADLMEWTRGWTLRQLVPPILARPIRLEALVSRRVPAITDDRPFNEYYLLRRWRDKRRGRHHVIP